MLAGGVDYGEKDTAVRNPAWLPPADCGSPWSGAGNVAVQEEVQGILEGDVLKVYPVKNVYPRVDELVVEPARAVIQEVFEEHITGAPGMDKIRDMVYVPILPTPGAVMQACKMLHPTLGDLVAVDVGGATTDVHSVAKGVPRSSRFWKDPEPLPSGRWRETLAFTSMPETSTSRSKTVRLPIWALTRKPFYRVFK